MQLQIIEHPFGLLLISAGVAAKQIKKDGPEAAFQERNSFLPGQFLVMEADTGADTLPAPSLKRTKRVLRPAVSVTVLLVAKGSKGK